MGSPEDVKKIAIEDLKTVLKDYSFTDDEKIAAIKKLGTMRDKEVIEVLFSCIIDDGNTLCSHTNVFSEEAPIQQAAVVELTQILQADPSFLNDAELVKISEMKTRLQFHFEG